MNHSTAVKRLSKKLRQDLAGWRLPDVPPKAIKVVCPRLLPLIRTRESLIVPGHSAGVQRKPDDLDSMFCDLVSGLWRARTRPKAGDPPAPRTTSRKKVREVLPYQGSFCGPRSART